MVKKLGTLFYVLKMYVGCASGLVRVHFLYYSLYVCAGRCFPVLSLLPSFRIPRCLLSEMSVCALETVHTVRCPYVSWKPFIH